MTFPDEVLMAYADDELDAGTRAAVDAAMAADPEIARRVAQHKALRNRFHSAFSKVLDEPVPARLRPRSDNVVPLRRRQARRSMWPQWTAIAASLIVGAIIGRLALIRPDNSGPIATTGGQLLASGALAGALTDQLASAQTAADPVRIGVSFRSKSRQYCRTFALASPATIAGVACRAADGWRIGALARTEPQSGDSGSYRQAASAMPPAVLAAVNSQIAGEPLDAAAEAAARARHWQP